MKILFLARSTLYTVFGGDTVQVESTAKYLRKKGLEVDIKLSGEHIDYTPYDLLHFFNIIRPADILGHISKTKKPFVVSTIFVDYSEYEKNHRTGIYGLWTRLISGDRLEYMKAVARWIKNGERIQSRSYLYRGHAASVRYIAQKAALLLPNSESEYRRFAKQYGMDVPHRVIYNGIDPDIFMKSTAMEKPESRNPKLVLCVSRIEGRKNQLNLIKALNHTEYSLYLIGEPSANHLPYYEACKKAAADNIHFLGFVAPDQLSNYYRNACVHVLPSWNETCGLSSLEAACNGCNIVVTRKGDTEEYYGKEAWYCDPAVPDSIFKAIDQAAKQPYPPTLRERIIKEFTWEKTAEDTLAAYRTVLLATQNK